MWSAVEKLLDLPREIRIGTTWLVLATITIGIDAYLLARFDLSLLSLLQQADPLSSVSKHSSLWLEALCAIATCAFVWFYVMPVLAHGWSQMIFFIQLKLPDWMRSASYPERSNGWRWTRDVRIQALEENNAGMLAACDRRDLAAEARKLVLRCVLTAIAFTLAASWMASDKTGPSLVEALYAWVSDLPDWQSLLLGILSLPGAMMVVSVLVEHGAAFDSYIRLTSPEAAKPPPRYRGHGR